MSHIISILLSGVTLKLPQSFPFLAWQFSQMLEPGFICQQLFTVLICFNEMAINSL